MYRLSYDEERIGIGLVMHPLYVYNVYSVYSVYSVDVDVEI